jgi:hypothetical protein
MGLFINQNWVVNFVNLIHFGPLTYSTCHLSPRPPTWTIFKAFFLFFFSKVDNIIASRVNLSSIKKNDKRKAMVRFQPINNCSPNVFKASS